MDQYWQRDKKDEVNNSERKIGGADLGPVTQLFTENYMVRFLLENSLGAWWAARHPDSPLIKAWEFLRFDDDGKPAAGSFDGWPATVAEVTVMDPCCGSGHFLVEAFSMLWQMRAEEENLNPVAAQDAVLEDNLFGLELDPRCVQIAMFAAALTAWKAGGGWRELPIPNIACSGIPVKASVDEWKQLAGGDERLENALVRLHILFRDADTLGSLIDPKRAVEISDPTGLQASFDDVDWDDIQPLLTAALTKESDDPAMAVLGADAAGIARAADYLSRQYTLIATNVPYLGISKQTEVMQRRISELPPGEGLDLALAWIPRFNLRSQTIVVVAPETWRFLSSYRRFREWILGSTHLRMIASLGSGAFSISLYDYPIGLFIVSSAGGAAERGYWACECTGHGKQRTQLLSLAGQTIRHDQSLNPGSRVQTQIGSEAGRPVREFADVKKGMSTGDAPVFVRRFWEVASLDGEIWSRVQSAPGELGSWSGCGAAIIWEGEEGRLAAWAASVSHLNHAAQAWRQAKDFWGRRGVAVQLMGSMHSSPYSGEIFDSTVAVLIPRDPDDLAPLWAAVEAGDLTESIRSFHSKVSVESDTILDARLDLEKWREDALLRFPDGLPEPWSDDPTQWLFDGRPAGASEPLQVAVGRLLGFCWPEQAGSDDLDEIADDDGIVCLPSVSGERTAAARLQDLLAREFVGTWSPTRNAELLAASGSKKKDLESWLRDEFFKAHCQVFKNRPFVWHVWDGRKDGFSALVNYHRLDRATLERLTYTYLGDWIELLVGEQRAGCPVFSVGMTEPVAAMLERP